MRVTKMVMAVALMVFAGSLFADCDKVGGCGKDAKKGRPGMQGKKGCGPMMMMKDLNLTEDQKAAIKDLHETNSKKMEEARKAVGEARKALMEAASSEDVTEAAVKELSSQLADAISVMALNRAEMQKEVKALLTPEQQDKFEKKMGAMQERMGKMRKSMCGKKGEGCGKDGKKGCGKDGKGCGKDGKKGCEDCDK